MELAIFKVPATRASSKPSVRPARGGGPAVAGRLENQAGIAAAGPALAGVEIEGGVFDNSGIGGPGKIKAAARDRAASLVEAAGAATDSRVLGEQAIGDENRTGCQDRAAGAAAADSAPDR